MIVSASYKTDIPAFYGTWFMNRLRAGSCKMVNPYGRQIYSVSLSPAVVNGFVFWTKNVGPFLQHLPEVAARGFPFVVQLGINGYPRALESSVADADRAVDQMRRLAAEYGPEVAVWRYDPIVFTSLTPPDFHLRNFSRLARALEGVTNEVVISFAQIYKKTQRNMEAASARLGFTWYDPPDDAKLALARDLTDMARASGIQLTTCAQNQYLVPGALPARCVDADRLSRVAGRPVTAQRKGNRPDCACSQSRDIGDYDTCPHGCVYCYAVVNHSLARERHRRHDPEGEFLFSPPSQ